MTGLINRRDRPEHFLTRRRRIPFPCSIPCSPQYLLPYAMVLNLFFRLDPEATAFLEIWPPRSAIRAPGPSYSFLLEMDFYWNNNKLLRLRPFGG
jgi:hypothetical protein